MDETEASNSFFQDLENFGNAVGNTLDGLLTSDWDLGDDNDNDVSTGSNSDSMARRRIARPLMFYNPVFYYFNRTVKNKDVPKFISSPKTNIVEEEEKATTSLDVTQTFAQLRRGSVLNVGKSPKIARKNSRALKDSLKDVASSSSAKISRALSRRTTKRRKRSESQTVTRDEGNVCTMNSVIATMKTKDIQNDQVPPQVAPQVSPPSASPTLQRNKTIRWGGTRKAPGLIREFTLKQEKKRAESDPLQHDQLQAKEMEAKASQSPSIYIKKEQLSYIKFSSLLPPAPQLKRTNTSKIRGLLHKLGTNPNNAFGYAVTKFVSEVKLGREKRPLILLHDVRSFMTDIKTCLLLNPHFGFIQKIQSFLSQEESRTNVESGAIDDGLERLVLLPLHHVLYQQLVICYHTSGKLKMLEQCFAVAKTKTAHELGVRSSLVAPSDKDFETIKRSFVQLQQTYSPYLKLKCLLTAVKTIYRKTNDLTCGENEPARIGADDFLPLFVYSIVKCEFLAADIEAQYIEGLLDQSLLLGEAGYYLTSLISAMQVLFSMRQRHIDLPHIYDLQAFLKVGIRPDDRNCAVIYKTLHVPPNMTSRNLCQMIALKYKITNYQEYCLHVVINGHAWPLQPDECPQLVKADLMTQMERNAFHFDFIKMTSNNTGDKVASTKPYESSKQPIPQNPLPKTPNVKDQQKKIVAGKEPEQKTPQTQHQLTAPNQGSSQFYNPLCDDIGSDVGDDAEGQVPLEEVEIKREISKIFKDYTGPVVEEIFDDPDKKCGKEDEKTIRISDEELHSHEKKLEQVKIVIEHNIESVKEVDCVQEHSNDDMNCTTQKSSLMNDVSENKAIPCTSSVSTNARHKEVTVMEVRDPESEMHEEHSLGKSEIVEDPVQKNKRENMELTDVVSVELTTSTDVRKLDDGGAISAAIQQNPDDDDDDDGLRNNQQAATEPKVNDLSDHDQYGENKSCEFQTGHNPHPEDPTHPESDHQLTDVQTQINTQLSINKEILIEDISIDVIKNTATQSVLKETTSYTAVPPSEETSENSSSEHLSIDIQHDSNVVEHESANKNDVGKEFPSQTVETSKEEIELALKIKELNLSNNVSDATQSFADPGKLSASVDNEKDTSSDTTVESTYALDQSYPPTSNLTANEAVRNQQESQQLNIQQQQTITMQHRDVKGADVDNETLDVRKTDERVLGREGRITKSDDENTLSITEEDTATDINPQQLVTPLVEDDKLGASKKQTLMDNDVTETSKTNVPSREEEDKTEQTVATTSCENHQTPPLKPPRRATNSPQKTFTSINAETHKKPTLYLELDENLYRSLCRSTKVSDLKKFFESKTTQ